MCSPRLVLIFAVVLCLAVPAFSFAPLGLRLPVRAARVGRPAGLCQLRAQARQVSRTEVIAIKRQSNGLQGDELREWLAARGYTENVQEEVVKAIASGVDEEKGAGDTLWEKQLVEADEMASKATDAETKLSELKEKEKTIREKIQFKLEPKAQQLEKSVDDAKAAQGGFMAGLTGAAARLASAQKNYDAAMQELEESEKEAGQIASEVKLLESRIDSVKKASAELKGTATRIRLAQEAAEQGKLIGSVSRVISAAERALDREGPEVAKKILADGQSDFDKLGLVPNRRAGLTSLPGRLDVLIKEIENPSPKTADIYAQAGGGDSSGVVLVALGLAVAGGLAYYSTLPK